MVSSSESEVRVEGHSEDELVSTETSYHETELIPLKLNPLKLKLSYIVLTDMPH